MNPTFVKLMYGSTSIHTPDVAEGGRIAEIFGWRCGEVAGCCRRLALHKFRNLWHSLGEVRSAMQIQHVGYRIRGCYRVAALGHLWEMIPKDAQERLRMLQFWGKHGRVATRDAFGVSRRTLYRWKAELRVQGGNPAARAAQSCAPKRRRTSRVDPRLVAEIRRLRIQHPNIGKAKLRVLLEPWCMEHRLAVPSESRIGRLIARAPDKMRHSPARLDARGRAKPVKRSRKPRKPKEGTPTALQCLAADTLERVRDGLKRYLVTFIDPASAFA